jgi:hypothetical protein
MHCTAVGPSDDPHATRVEFGGHQPLVFRRGMHIQFRL